MNLGRLSSRRWQSFPTAPDGTGLILKITYLKFLILKFRSIYHDLITALENLWDLSKIEE
jgi:hypothetical protein